jgi:hypothetical protein
MRSVKVAGKFSRRRQNRLLFGWLCQSVAIYRKLGLYINLRGMVPFLREITFWVQFSHVSSHQKILTPIVAGNYDLCLVSSEKSIKLSTIFVEGKHFFHSP